jgi:hypothetical protein
VMGGVRISGYSNPDEPKAVAVFHRGIESNTCDKRAAD